MQFNFLVHRLLQELLCSPLFSEMSKISTEFESFSLNKIFVSVVEGIVLIHYINTITLEELAG
jgi:hypothetical protein